jgi:GxxExxY protein
MVLPIRPLDVPLRFTNISVLVCLESVCEACFIDELEQAGISARAQVYLPVRYKGKDLGGALKLDLLKKNKTI